MPGTGIDGSADQHGKTIGVLAGQDECPLMVSAFERSTRARPKTGSL
jgi:hypothetical protein